MADTSLLARRGKADNRVSIDSNELILTYLTWLSNTKCADSRMMPCQQSLIGHWSEDINRFLRYRSSDDIRCRVPAEQRQSLNTRQSCECQSRVIANSTCSSEHDDRGCVWHRDVFVRPNGPAYKLRPYLSPCAKMTNVQCSRQVHESMLPHQTKGADSFIGLSGSTVSGD